MTTARFCFAVLASCCVFLSLPLAADSQEQAQPDKAQALYDKGDYSGAYKQFLKRAKKDDNLARYRVSYMLAMGLGVEFDPIESLAWAVLATDNGATGLGRYQDAVAALVPENERRKAQKTTDNFRRRWDRKNYNSRAHSGGGCTGSKLSANCGGSTKVSSPRIPWGEDRSGDPAQKQLIEDMNRSILEETFHLDTALPAS
jgi:hypothetical protein